MYTNYNYSNIPMNSNIKNVPYSYNKSNQSNDRFVGGGFLGPFILGGITGGLIAPAFYQRPYYNNYYYPYPTSYYYGGYYR